MIRNVTKNVAKSALKKTILPAIKVGAIQLRNFSKYRMLGLGGFETPNSKEDVISKIRKQFEIAKNEDFLNPKSNVLNIIASHEFSFNGSKNFFGINQYNASNPIPADIYKVAIKECQDILKKLPEGILFFPGTAAIDTGVKNKNGEPRYENRGCGITSGPNSEIFEFSKQSVSNLDGWKNNSDVIEGKDPIVVEIKDKTGDGRSMWISCSVCLDFIKHIENFSNPPDAIFVPACGWPRKMPEIDSDIIVMDGILNPSRPELITQFSGVHKIEKHNFEPSSLAVLISNVASENIKMPKLITSLAKKAMDSEYIKEQQATQRFLTMQDYKYKMVDDKVVVKTDEFSINHLYEDSLKNSKENEKNKDNKDFLLKLKSRQDKKTNGVGNEINL